MAKKYLKSRWIFAFGKEGRNLIFNSNNLDIYFIDKELSEVLKYFSIPHTVSDIRLKWPKKIGLNEVINSLIRKNILIPADHDELSEQSEWVQKQIQQRQREIGKNLNLNALRIVLTEKCNFNCRYCFVKHRQKTLSGSISWDNLKKSIDLLVSLNKKGHIEIHFFGGEPLIEFSLIAKTVDYIEDKIKSKEIKSSFYAITTNTTLVDERMAEFFKKNHFLVSVSIDGWEKIHDQNRRYLDGRQTFNDVIKGLKILKKYKNDIGVLVTPTEETVEYLAKACEYIIKKLKCKYITINSPQPVKGNWAINGRVFAKEVKKCMEVAKKNKAAITTLGTRVLYALDEKIPLILSCSKFENNFTGSLSTHGEISPCIVSWNLGNTLTPIEKFNYKGNFTKWKLTPPYHFERCLNCPAMNVCGGPCPLEIYDMKNSLKPKNHDRCAFFNEFLEWALWYKV